MENQVFKQESCHTDVKHNMELKIDLQDLQHKYDLDGKLMFKTTALLLDNLNTSYEATISILDNGSPNQDSKQIHAMWFIRNVVKICTVWTFHFCIVVSYFQ